MKHPPYLKSKLLTIFFAWIFIPMQISHLFAQESTTLYGTVLDENTEPLIGVIVKQKDTPNATATDISGNFTLANVPLQSILVFTYLGMQTQEIPYTGQKHITVTLKNATNQIDEVVVVGYGSMRKSDLTGSVASLDSKTIMERTIVNPIDALSGRVAGVAVSNNSGRPGGQLSVVVRGMNSINASNSPLFVIDGVVGADISMINPNDIESMSVLKDASATAIYGARGASGVVIVTTKRGSFGDGTKIRYNMSLGVSTLARKRNLLSSDEFMTVLNEAFKNDGFEPVDWYKVDPTLFTPDGKPIYNTDWQDEMTRNALSQRHYITVENGSQNSKTMVSFGYQDENGIMIKSWLKRYNAKISNDLKIGKRLTLSTSLNYNYTKESRMDDFRIGADHTARVMLEAYPLIPVKYSDGTWSKYGDFLHPGVLIKDGNPVLNEQGQKVLDYNNSSSLWQADNGVQIIEETDRLFATHQLLANAALDIDIWNGLKFRTTYGLESKWRKEDFYSGENLLGFSAGGAVASEGIANNTYWQSENFFTYDKAFKEHRINATLGASWNGNTETGVSGSGQGFTSDFYQWYNLAMAEKPGVPQTNWTEWRMNSYYARANYTYKSRYMATVTGRYDGSSVFGKDNRYAFFPSGALAWVISEEDFLKKNKIISNLKLRATVGKTGNAGIGPYSTLPTLTNVNVTFADKEFQGGIIQSGMPNSNLKWETTTQYDAGLDIGLLKNRISLGLDAYWKITDNLLLAKPFTWVNGYASVMDNVGKIQNRGFEATLNTHNIKSKDFNWYSTLIFTTNRNKVLELSGDQSDLWMRGFVGINYALIRKGEPLNSIYGLKRDGVGTWGIAEAAEAAKYGKLPGDKKYVDKNKDYKIDYENDGEIIGNLLPKFEMSFTNNLAYKNFDFTLELQGKFGNKAANMSRMTSEQRTWYANSPKTVLNFWTPENQNTMIERPRTTMPYGGHPQEMQIDDNLVEDASFVRFKNLMIGYTIPQTLATKLKLQSLRFYVNAENFLMFTNYSGYDPEVENMGAFSQGVEFFAYPKSKNFNFGLTVAF